MKDKEEKVLRLYEVGALLCMHETVSDCLGRIINNAMGIIYCGV